jgi:hypothetical protein
VAAGQADSAARRHLGNLVALIFIRRRGARGSSYPDAPVTGAATATVAFGASYTTPRSGFPFLSPARRWSSSLPGAGLSLWYGFSRRGWPLALAVGLYLAVR